MAVDPSLSELQELDTVEAIQEWCGISPGLMRGLRKTMGKMPMVRDVILIREEFWNAALPQLRVWPEKAKGVAVTGAKESADAKGSTGSAGGGGPLQDPAATLAAVKTAIGTAADSDSDDEPPIPPEGRPLKPVEYGQVDSFRRVARLRQGLPAVEPASGAPALGAATGPAGAAGAGHMVTLQGNATGNTVQAIVIKEEKKLKMSEVFDQGDRTEFVPWTPARYRAVLAAFKSANEGEESRPIEKATIEQMAALEHKLNTGASPCADFAVWRPHGQRWLRAQKLQAQQVQADGSYKLREVAAPASFKEWVAAWRVFAMAMRALGAAKGVKLALYEKHIEELADRYHKFWWLVAQADARMRSERWEYILAEAEAAKTAATSQGRPHDLDEAKPWDYVIKASVSDEFFWRTELSEKIGLYSNHLATISELADPGFGTPTFVGDGGGAGGSFQSHKRRRQNSSAPQASKGGGGGSSGSGKGAGKGKNKSTGKGGPADSGKGKRGGKAAGKHVRTADNKRQLCWEWNRQPNGCSDRCPAGRAHQCEICLGNHRSINCTSS